MPFSPVATLISCVIRWAAPAVLPCLSVSVSVLFSLMWALTGLSRERSTVYFYGQLHMGWAAELLEVFWQLLGGIQGGSPAAVKLTPAPFNAEQLSCTQYNIICRVWFLFNQTFHIVQCSSKCFTHNWQAKNEHELWNNMWTNRYAEFWIGWIWKPGGSYCF